MVVVVRETVRRCPPKERERGEAQDAHLDYRTGGRMTIRPGQPLSCNSPPKPSFKGMDVVMMNDFEQRHRTSAKSRSHSPFGHIGSPTTPLNFEQLFQLNSELSHHDHTMLQAQLLNTMRHNNTPTTTMTPKPKLQHQQSQPSLVMLDQLRQAYNSQEQADWSNARQDEPSTIALLQQKFAQLERHKAEMQQQQQKPYPSQWTPVSSSAAVAPTYTESRFAPTSNSTFYSFHAPPVDSAPEQFSWRTTHDAPPSQMVYQQQQFQHPPQSKVVEYQHHPVPQFSAAPPQSSGSFTGFQLNAPPAAAAVPDMSLLGVSPRCDKTGGHSVEIKSVQHQDHHHYADSEMSLDNFSGRIMPQVQQPVAPTSSQMTFSSNFHMLPQSSKSAFTTFTRASSNLNPHHPVEAVVTKSLLFNDPYRHSSHEVPDSLHDDVDTELHL